MADNYLRASNGAGDAVMAVVTTERTVGSATLITDSVLNWPHRGIATSGVLDPVTGIIDPDTATVFKYHLDGSIITIDEFAPGYPDVGNAEDEVVVIKPATLWADLLAERVEEPGLPPGGTAGQILTKQSATDGDADWEEPAGSVSIITKETPGGTVDGSNTDFTTNLAYVEGSLQVYVNGLAQSGLITEDDPAAGEFSLDTAPETGDDLSVSYQYAPSATGNADTLDGYHLSGILEAIYPVGSIYIGSDDGTMPALIASIGTWVRVEGRVIVGVDDGDSDFDYDDEGGEKTHTLTTTEMPAHTHDVVQRLGNAGNSHLGANGYLAQAGSDMTITSASPNAAATRGGGGAHNNLQPYKSKYIWERTA